jgi:hypothetical protein
MGSISLFVPAKFRFPIFSSGRRHPSLSARRMLMPKATVHKNYFPTAMKYDVRASRELTLVQSIPIAKPVEQPPQD